MTNSNKLMCTAGENCPENLLKLKDTTLISEWIGFFVAEAFKVSGGRYPLTMYCVFYYRKSRNFRVENISWGKFSC